MHYTCAFLVKSKLKFSRNVLISCEIFILPWHTNATVKYPLLKVILSSDVMEYNKRIFEKLCHF
jgi:hypothetical protein